MEKDEIEIQVALKKIIGMFEDYEPPSEIEVYYTLENYRKLWPDFDPKNVTYIDPTGNYFGIEENE